MIFRLLLLLLLSGNWLFAENEIFPPGPDAKPFIDFDGHGFLVRGRRTWISSGSVHYARLPRDQWRERLLQVKRAGYNGVQTYAFWNFHEIHRGKFDFTGDKDFGAFLDLAHDLGLYVTVRVGPYVCAEWENGGYPMWLRFVPGMIVRSPTPEFLEATDSWYDHVLAIVAPRQIQNGGSVIMVQLENEYPRIPWGTDADPYLAHLLKKARADGISVPMFFSGLHHGVDPAPDQPMKSAGRASPWYTTEFWTGWYDLYGELPDLLSQFKPQERSVQRFDRGTWRILSNGGNGFNHYLIFGGTNFATWNDNEVAAAYDYGTSIGQTGDLRRLYYRVKRAATFAHSFQSILENCEDSTAAHKDLVSGVSLVTRTGPAGTALFFDNPRETDTAAQLKDGQKIEMGPYEVAGTVRDFALNSRFTIASCDARIYGVAPQGKTTTLILTGLRGESGRLTIKASHPRELKLGSKNWSRDSSNRSVAVLDFQVNADEPQEFTLTSGSQVLRVLVMHQDLADRTWIVDAHGSTYVVCGPEYLGEFAIQKGKYTFATEAPLAKTTPANVLIYAATGAPVKITGPAPGPEPAAPALQPWKSFSAVAEAAPGYNDAKWKSSPQPLPMGADGDTSAYAWYRAKFTCAQAGRYFLQIPFVADHAEIFLNGASIPIPGKNPTQTGAGEQEPLVLLVTVKAGVNHLAVLVSHEGRSKFFPYVGPLEKMDVKGIEGPVTLAKSDLALFPLDQWTVNPVGKDAGDHSLDNPPATSSPSAKALNYAANNMTSEMFARPGFTWFRAKLPQLDGPNRVLHIGFFYGKTVVYLNGRKVGKSSGTKGSLEIPLDRGWKDGEPNILSVRSKNSTGYEGNFGRVYLKNGTPDIVIKGWKMRGDVQSPLDPLVKWADPAEVSSGTVTLYQTHFNYVPNPDAKAILRFSTKGLTSGFVWLNGHNVGHFPEKVPVDGLYLPECWIKPGDNTLSVVENRGASIADTKIYVERGASRWVHHLTQP